MGKINSFFCRKSIKRAFVFYMLAGVLTALLLAMFLSGICQIEQHGLYRKYQEKYGLAEEEWKIRFENSDEEGERYAVVRTVPEAENVMSYFSPADRGVYDALEILNLLAYPLCFAGCVVATSFLFYRRILKKPLAILEDAAGRIAKDDLDFEVAYQREDEMGRLCDSFERMRCALRENHEELWRQMEERKRLNAAFAHDLRTPLTVLKGQSEILVKYAPRMTAEKMENTSEMMRRHILRLEDYVDTMGDLLRLEDITVERQEVELAGLMKQMRMTGEGMCGEKTFLCTAAADEGTRSYLDASVVLRVFENLLSNALRFARERIAVSMDAQDGFLYLTVSDDGPGFGREELENAAKPFYKTSQRTDSTHFGMGLYICKILCEKHGGYLKLGNGEGAFVTAAFRAGDN